MCLLQFFIFRVSNKIVKNFVMNTSKSAQDVLRCHLCETPVPPLCCEICHIYLCKVCVADHILDETTEHKVVSIKQTLSTLLYPKCLNHSSKNCEHNITSALGRPHINILQTPSSINNNHYVHMSMYFN